MKRMRKLQEWQARDEQVRVVGGGGRGGVGAETHTQAAGAGRPGTNRCGSWGEGGGGGLVLKHTHNCKSINKGSMLCWQRGERRDRVGSLALTLSVVEASACILRTLAQLPCLSSCS